MGENPHIRWNLFAIRWRQIWVWTGQADNRLQSPHSLRPVCWSSTSWFASSS